MKYATLAVRTAAVPLVVALIAPGAAKAEGTTPSYVGMTEQDVGVMDRARPAYDAKGIPLGGFRLFPALNTSASFDDNVFKTADALSDWFFTISPAARLKSQWGRHFLELYSGLNYYNYQTYTKENLTDWNIGTDGKLDISRSANMSANVFYGQMHELWSAPNNVAGYQAAPNRYFQTHVDVSSVYQPNRLGFGLGGVFDNYNWTTTPVSGGGVFYNDDRDNNEFQAYAKAYYDFSPGYSGYLKVSYDERDFNLYTDRSGLHRSSHGYRVDAGVNLQISHLISGEVYVGYMQQNFAASLADVSGIDFGAQLDWYVSPVLTAHLSGSRSLDNVVLSGVSVADNKNVTFSADYEFRPNVIVQGRVAYTNTRYVGSGRTDDYPSVGIGVMYLVNRYVSLNVNYNYSERSTDTPALAYTDNTVSIGLALHI
ncbi:outer membrane beta-barrel protein [Rhizomicrobium electricum]|uniref:Outer membrane beta-barrel protein n=1 Tax=Rhizomicrobium electricum TaxID=480070 RepID=A0ABP3P6A0_9PROT|nr:outer membrane beta-barrel protein [Rhizomicrobium electricum]NIJ47908.1 hypothetical protein [Rhizomicrobium electricum]